MAGNGKRRIQPAAGLGRCAMPVQLLRVQRSKRRGHT